MKRPNSHQHSSEGERSTDNGAIPSATTLLYSLVLQSRKFIERKRTFALIILFWFTTHIGLAQSDSIHQKFYYAIVDYTNGASAKSILYDVSDSALVLQSNPGTLLYSLSYHDIEKIKIRKKGSAGKGILVGTLSGILVGVVTGAASYKAPEPGSFAIDPGPGGSAIAGGFLGGLGGLIVGGIIGSVPTTTIKINHTYKNFLNAIPTIKNYCPNH